MAMTFINIKMGLFLKLIPKEHVKIRILRRSSSRSYCRTSDAAAIPLKSTEKVDESPTNSSFTFSNEGSVEAVEERREALVPKGKPIRTRVK